MNIYRQVAHRLRINRGPGRPDKVSERPRAGRRGDWREFLDSDEAPTLIAFDEYDQVNIPALLAQGAIAPHTPPRRAARRQADGEARGE